MTDVAVQERTPQAMGSVLSGAGVMVASRLTIAAFGWIGTILIARDLSAGDPTGKAWGAYSFIFSLLGILGLLADLQISRVVMVELLDAGDDVGPVVGQYVALRFALALASYGLAVGIVILAGYPQQVVIGTLIGGLSFFMASTFWALVTVCQIRLWLRPVAIALVLGQMVQFVVTLALYLTHNGTVVRYAVPAVLYDVVSMVVLVIAVRSVVHVRPRIDLQRWWVWIKAAVPLALGSSLATLYFRIDSVMLSKMKGLAEVGRYQFGYKFSDILGFVASSLLGVVLPLLVRAWPHRMRDFHRTFRQAFILLLIAGAAAATAFAVVAGRALPSLFNAPHSAALPARVLVLGQSLNFFSQLCAMTLIATERHRIYPWATFTGVVVNVLLNLLLIPHFAATGSGMATVFTEVAVISVMAAIVVKIDGVRPFPWRAIVVVAFAATAMGATIWFLMQVVMWPVALLGGIPVYLAVLHVFGVDGRGGLRKLARDSRVDLSRDNFTSV